MIQTMVRSSALRLRLAVYVFGLLISCVVTHAQTPTAFTYQGRLTDAGSPANGTYDFEFKLFDGSATQLGTSVTREDVTVTNGVFLVQLDFGISPFTPNATASTLEIGVRPGTSTAAFTTLSPRQPITSTPYAVQTINAEKLGGVAADQYVKTDDPRLGGSGNNSYVQNSTTQQPNVSFNIGGNGLFGGQVGIGTQTPGVGLKLDVNGLARFLPGGTGGAIQLGSPNGETGITISNQLTRADIRHDTGVLKLLNGPAGGPPSDASGITIDSFGNVVMGSTGTGSAKLSVVGGSNQPGLYAETNNRAVWGKSIGSSYGVYGESGDGIGVQGTSTNNIAVSGLSTSNLGVFGASGGRSGVLGQSGYVGAADSGEAGVKGVSTASNGTGVRGEGMIAVRGVSTQASGTGVWGSNPNNLGVSGDTDSGIGVTGVAVSGTGVRGTSTFGYAMYAAGNVGQTPLKGGFVKAMIRVNANGTIAACYNSQLPDGGASAPPSGHNGCGFTANQATIGFDDGAYSIDFGFQFSFFAVTPGFSGNFAASASVFSPFSGIRTLIVQTFVNPSRLHEGAPADFTVIIF